jgi:RNA polymerase sigma factor (sigma-70 family)
MSEIDLSAVIRAEPAAVRSFIRSYGPIFRALFWRRVVGPWRGGEEDVIQDIFVALFAQNCRALRAWDPQKGRSLKGFLTWFAEKRIADWLRQQKRRGREEPTAEDAIQRQVDANAPGPDEPPPEWVPQVYDHYQGEVSAEDRQIIELRYEQELAVADVAQRTGLSVAAVYQRLHRIKVRLLKLRDALSKKPPSET